MKNRLQKLFHDRTSVKLSVYFTAGFPGLNDTLRLLAELEQSGVDFVEIGFPFSDPLADGPVIQGSSRIALRNGMHLQLLFEQLQCIRDSIKVPLVLMGYFNPVMQYGVEHFVESCVSVGIDGVIFPDLPVDIYLEQYQELFISSKLSFIPLITPSTLPDRIHYLDENTDGFIYMVSSHSTTGSTAPLTGQESYFRRIKSMNLKNPLVLGFGVRTKEDIAFATPFCDGIIIGSAFIQHLQQYGVASVSSFIRNIQS